MFPNYKQMVQHAIPSLVVKTMEQYVMSVLDLGFMPIISLNLWCLDLNMTTLFLQLISTTTILR